MNTPQKAVSDIPYASGKRYTRRLAAEYLGINEGTLAKWASVGYPCVPYHKVGKKVIYLQIDLDDFLRNHRVVKGKGDE